MEIRFGTPEQFADLRDLLIRAEYTGASICERRGTSSLREAAAAGENREPAEALDVLIRLLLHGLPVETSAVNKLMDPALVGALEYFGLIAVSGPGYRGTAMLHPWGSLYVASDSVRGIRNELPDDFVFPVLTPQTGRFLASLPDEPCGDLLDLCSGSGIAALVAAADYSKHVWACDVTRRATQFAEFNRRLNNLSNLTALEGDLYRPVEGLSFDRIVAHPPYVPSLNPAPVYRDGGPDGEQITRRIVEGAFGHLRPGGRLYCTAMLSDRRQAPLEQRLRSMLHRDADEFDIFMFRREAFTPLEYCGRLTSLDPAASVDTQQWLERFERLEVERLVTCSFIAQRRERPRGVVTVSRQIGPGSSSMEMESVRRVETAAIAV